MEAGNGVIEMSEWGLVATVVGVGFIGAGLGFWAGIWAEYLSERKHGRPRWKS